MDWLKAPSWGGLDGVQRRVDGYDEIKRVLEARKLVPSGNMVCPPQKAPRWARDAVNTAPRVTQNGDRPHNLVWTIYAMSGTNPKVDA